MKKVTSITLLALLSGLYIIGSALGYFLFFEPSGFIFTSLISEEKTTALLLTIELSMQHFIIALIAAIPVCLIMVKIYKKHVYLLTAVITLPVAFIGVIGIWSVDGLFNILTLLKDMAIIILTPVIVSWLFIKLDLIREKKELPS